MSRRIVSRNVVAGFSPRFHRKAQARQRAAVRNVTPAAPRAKARDYISRPVSCATALLVLMLVVTSIAFGAGNDVRLIEAVRSKDAATIRTLLKSRVDVNTTQGDGATALHWAVHYSDLATIDLLLHAGARVNVANDLGVTPLYLACTNRNSTVVEKLLSAEADPNAKLLNGETVLMNCARTGDPASVKALIAAGAKVNVKEPEHEQTALMWAAAEKHPEAVRLLLDAGADVRARSKSYTQTVTSEVTQRLGREQLNYNV